MADTDETAMDSCDVSSMPGIISDDSVNVQLRKRKPICKEPEELSISESIVKEPVQIRPESIGAASLSTETTPQLDLEQVELQGAQPTAPSFTCSSSVDVQDPNNTSYLESSDITYPEMRQEDHDHGDVNEKGNSDTATNVDGLENISLFSYLYAELTRGYLLEHDEAKFTEKRERVQTFMKIPMELEKFMVYGFLQCTDAFLYIFTFLPLRFMMAFIKLCVKGCFSSCSNSRGRILEPAQICDLIKGFILIICCILMDYVDVSMMYHLIRGQAIIKLYLFYNMLEVADRLFSSFGQDILDSLFWTATEPRDRRREHIGIIPHFFMAIVYVFLHTVLVLFQATTLNVAFNSHNKALLTIMMSNNFVELKGSVFKKFEKSNLFQMSCSDVRERFHLVILLAIVCVRNLTEFSWNMDHLFVLIPDVLMVIISEVMVDWVKHAFITKFNEISFEVYNEYKVSIAYDMSLSRQKNACADHIDVVSRRMGFIPLPLAAILVRIISQSLRITQYIDVLLIILVYFCIVTLKVLNSIWLLGKAVKLIKNNKRAKQANKKASAATQPSSPSKDGTKVKRSRSVGENMNLDAALNQLKKNTEHLRQPSLTPKPLFSNSTVSLQSVGLNDEFVKDTDREGTPPDATAPNAKSKMPTKPLHEIDRYTMCSNRII